jgi:tetratricopeptide (TPR) repeat protein
MDLRAYLHSLDAETLADLLHEQAARDPELHTRLELRASGDLAEVRTLLDHRHPESDQERFGEAAKVGAVLDTLQRLLDAGTQADVAPLARRAVDRITEALRHVDDSSGAVGAELHRAVGLYARACAAHPPKPEHLADWIIGVEFDGPGWPEIELADFAQALGETGLRQLKSTVDRVLAEAEPGEPRRRTAERLDEQIAEISGDVDTLLEILSRQPPRLDVSRKIVRVLRTAGRASEAVAYAARALSQDKDQTERALRERAEHDVSAADELVRTLLDKERHEDAWRAAQRYHSSLPVLLELAQLREATCPADALVVYKKYIDHLIEQKDAAHYEQAAKHLRKVRLLHRKAGTPEEFAPYLAGLVDAHKRKARLLAEIRQARIALPKG